MFGADAFKAARGPNVTLARRRHPPGGECILSQSEQDCRIDYIEFPARDIAQAKRFFTDVFRALVGLELRGLVRAMAGQRYARATLDI